MFKKILNKFKKKHVHGTTPEVDPSTQEQQLVWLKNKFGTSMNDVDVTIPMTYSEVESFFGPQCDEYEPLCGCCSAWMEWSKTNKVTVSINRQQVIDLLLGE